MLKAIIMSQRDEYILRIGRCENAMRRIKREGIAKASYRRSIALYRDLIAVIDKHDTPHMELAE